MSNYVPQHYTNASNSNFNNFVAGKPPVVEQN